ncbi:hypothetical protein [Nitrospira sp. Nam74]
MPDYESANRDKHALVRRTAINVPNLVLLLATLVLVGVLLELLLAVSKINTKATIRWIPDKVWTQIPGAYYRHTKEGFSEGYYNSHGYRDYERTYDKPPNSFRILVLGDSYVEALQVSLEDTFSALLEKKLNAVSESMRFEVLALGESGFGTANEYMRYLDFGTTYSPDLVIVALTIGNDILNNSKFLNREKVQFYFAFDEHKNLVLDRSVFNDYQDSLKRRVQRVKEHSYLASFIADRLSLLYRQWKEGHWTFTSDVDEAANTDGELGPYSYLNMYRSDLTPAWKEAFDITTGLVARFRTAVEERGARFLLMGICSAEQVHPERSEQLMKMYKLPFDFDQPNRILEQFSTREQIEFLDLMPTFREYHRKTGTYLHGFGLNRGGHWNENGHRLAAETMFEFLLDRHLVPLDPVSARGTLVH